MARATETHKTSRLLLAACVIIVIWGLQFGKEVLVPLAMATLISFLLTPLVERLERWKVNRVASVLLVVILAFAFFGVLGYVVTQQVKEVARSLPQYQGNIKEKVDAVRHRMHLISKATSEIQQIANQPTTGPASAPAGGTGALDGDGSASATPHVILERPTATPESSLTISDFTPVLQLVATAFVVIVLVIFMLLEREDLRDRIIRLSGQGRMNVTTQAMKDASTRVSRYLLVQTMINGSYGAVVAIGLLLIGVQGAILWGILFALLRFIPYAGPWLGAAMPCLLALALPGNVHFFLTIAMFGICEIAVSSWIEPWLYGAHTGVSSVAVLVAAIFWAWLWGVVGLLLATPLTVVLVVIGKYIPQLEFLSILLGDEQVFEPHTRYYQRLLASDQEEAEEVVEEDLKVKPLEEVYETVLLPALSMAALAHYRGRIDESRLTFIHQSMKDLVQELGERPPPPPTPKTDEEKAALARWQPVAGAANVRVLCLPARDEADEIAGMMFAQVLTRAGFQAEAVSVTPLAGEIVQMVAAKKADVSVISALPPAAVTHSRYLCKRLHSKFPEGNVMVGLWTLKGDIDAAKQRIACVKTDTVANAFHMAIRELEQLVHSLLLKSDKVEIPLPETEAAMQVQRAGV